MGWTKAQRELYYPLINVAVIVGCSIGSVAGGIFIGGGRRKTLIYGNIVIIISCVPMVMLNFWCLLFGKLVFGFAAAVVTGAVVKMLDETIPIYKLKIFGLYSNIYLNIGVTVAMLMGLGLPMPHDVAAMKTA